MAASLRKRSLMRLYGITVEEYDEMLALQGGGCAICGKPPGPRRLGVDHAHTGPGSVRDRVRGLLCVYCNHRLLGRHSPEKIISAARYLENPPARGVLSVQVQAPSADHGRSESRAPVRRGKAAPKAGRPNLLRVERGRGGPS